MKLEDKCVWYTGSTNAVTGEAEKPQWCETDCIGYNKICDYYVARGKYEKKEGEAE